MHASKLPESFEDSANANRAVWSRLMALVKPRGVSTWVRVVGDTYTKSSFGGVAAAHHKRGSTIAFGHVDFPVAHATVAPLGSVLALSQQDGSFLARVQ